MTDTESFSRFEEGYLHDLVDNETRALDVIASWENLCDAYRALEFTDPLSDTVKLEEYKWIIKQMNAHLTRARKKLMTCKDIKAARMCLLDMFNTSENASITSRRDIAYQKLKQRWVSSMLSQMEQLEMDLLEAQEMMIGDIDG